MFKSHLSLPLYLSLSKLDITVKNVLNCLKNDRCSFIFITLLVHTTTSIVSTKIFFQLISTSLFRPYLSIKPFLQFSLTLSSSIPQHFFIPFSCIQRSLQSESKVPSLPQPLSQFRLRQGTKQACKDWHCFSFSLLPQSIDRDSSHWFFIAQAQKIGVLQVLVSEEYACNQNGKPSSSPSLIPWTHIYFFQTLLTPSKENKLPYKPVI